MSVLILYISGDVSSNRNFNFFYVLKCVTVLRTTDNFESSALTIVKAS
jgi:hypothetical protein